MSNDFSVSVSWTALFLMLAFAAVVGPPAVSSVTSWWSIRLRRWAGRLSDAWARGVARARDAIRRAWARVVDRARDAIRDFLGLDGSR